MKDIRALAESWKDGGNPIIDRFARYVLAVEDALDALANDRGPLGTSHVGPMLAEGIRAAIARNLERK